MRAAGLISVSVIRAFMLACPRFARAFRHGGSSTFGLRAFPLFLALVCLPASASSAEFRASAAKADITPSGSVDLWGYSDRSGPATGKRDPLFAKVLLLDDGTHRLALVTLDLGRTFGLESMNFVRERVHKSAGVEQVFFLRLAHAFGTGDRRRVSARKAARVGDGGPRADCRRHRAGGDAARAGEDRDRRGGSLHRPQSPLRLSRWHGQNAVAERDQDADASGRPAGGRDSR